MSKFQYLFTPLKIGPITIKNRIIFGPHGTNHWPGYTADDRTVAYYEERAKGGVGLVIIGASPVDEDANYASYSQPILWNDDVIPGLAKVADAVHAQGAKLLIQIVHPGVHQNPDGDELRRPAVSPSQIPVTDRPGYIPKELDEEEILAIQDKFAAAAERVKKAGLDGVEIHCAHGYLVNQFLTPLKNKRTDHYGGSLENRFRFGREVLEKVRARVGADFVVGARIINSDLFPGGLDVDDYATIAGMIEGTGTVDYISVSTGLLRAYQFMVPTHYSGLEPGYQGESTSKIKASVKSLPVFQVGRIDNAALADRIIADGRADAVVIVRELVAEPYFAKKAEEGQTDDIRPCVYWNQGCVARNATGWRLECSLNAGTGHEREYGEDSLRPVARPKKVLIVGGGPAGLECGRVAALRGHEVVLYEGKEQLGGQLEGFIRLPKRQEVKSWLDWLERQVQDAGVTVKLGQQVNGESLHGILDTENPDAVVVATGARPARDGRSALTTEPIPGWDQDNVLTYEDVLRDGHAVGERVLILDEQGDRVSPGLAEMLAGETKEVEVMTRWPSLSHHWLSLFNETGWIYGNLDKLGVKVTPDSWILRISGTKVICYNVYSGREWEQEADSIVLVTMKYSNDELYKLLKSTDVKELHRIGDAVAPRWVSEAVREGMRLAYDL